MNLTCEIGPSGIRYWRQDNNLYREDGPAIECPNGMSIWFSNGLLHRIDGPAIEMPDGHKEYWLKGIRIIDPFVIWMINN